ncbi:uncharacterized protein A1O9_04077 [Exophiala aquamarina CBS 119918]|uniref:RING-type domain-containing protein n=1 Tax=Exophiala aquamarina CBS 119918 TaxID=1182545 RepID=A0A072PIU8_9EURO|nr:uncharacterized protein A1O9_04077 [Exophiala aquamarina CBS 119918]KEF59233.1 hypothetical protein A1O9_04077 [Exophiala aquamarina CBS 119918]
MYIPTQRFLRENEEQPYPYSSLADSFHHQLEPEPYYLGARSTVGPDQEQTSFNVPSTFVSVSVGVLIFLLLAIAFAVYKKCSGSDTQSDTESSVSDSAWRVEDPESESDATEAKHRKRLRKLDQVAPVHTAICLDLIGEDEQIRELQCGHVYHSACLNLWVERGHHDCPLCKYDILGLQQKNPITSPPEPEATNNDADPATRSPPSQQQHHHHHYHHGPHVVVISNTQPQSDASNVHGARSPPGLQQGLIE